MSSINSKAKVALVAAVLLLIASTPTIDPRDNVVPAFDVLDLGTPAPGKRRFKIVDKYTPGVIYGDFTISYTLNTPRPVVQMWALYTKGTRPYLFVVEVFRNYALAEVRSGAKGEGATWAPASVNLI